MEDADPPTPFDATLNEAQRERPAVPPPTAEVEGSVRSIDQIAVPRSGLQSATVAPLGWQEMTLPHRDGSSAGTGRRVSVGRDETSDLHSPVNNSSRAELGTARVVNVAAHPTTTPDTTPLHTTPDTPSTSLVPVPQVKSGNATHSSPFLALRTRRASVAGCEFTTGVHLNALQLTAAEEYALFRRRHHVSASYHGPIYVAEDVQVECQACGGPVDPVRRVPAGQLFFHPHCIRCHLCGRRGEAEPFSQVGTVALCGVCTARGYARCVSRRATTTSALCSSRAARCTASGSSLVAAEPALRTTTTTLNLPTLPGVTAPSLTIGGQLHTARNTSRRSFALMQRQQYYTQNDANLLLRPPKVGVAEWGTEHARAIDTTRVRALKMRRASQT